MQTSLSNTAIDNPMSRTKQTLVNSIIEFLDTDTIWWAVNSCLHSSAVFILHVSCLCTWFYYCHVPILVGTICIGVVG